MKKLFAIFLVLAMVFSIGFEYVVAKESPFNPFLPEIPVIDSHFMSYQEAGKFKDTSEKPELILGDATVDGKVDATDALFALIYGLDMPFDETAYKGGRVSKNNLYYRGISYVDYPGVYGSWIKIDLERRYMYYDQEFYFNQVAGLANLFYRYNSALVADVSNDGFSNAVDAMLILQYAVGKIDAFPRTDFSSKGNMFYVPWYDEWEPGMLWNEDIEEKTDSGYYSAFQ